MDMKPILLAAALLPLFSACSSERATPAPVQPLPLVVLTPGEPFITAVERKLGALSHEERITLAKALIATHDWGTWAQHSKLRATFGDEDLGNPLVNENIIKKLRLPADASPALREAVQAQLADKDECWFSFCGFIELVTDDYLPAHPQDARAWQFLSFIQYLSDGEVDYASCICGQIRAKGLDQYTEGQRILHRHEHWHGCGVKDCPLCGET